MIIDRQARIVEKKNWGRYFLFRLKSPEIARSSQPGQFLMIKVSETTSPLLRRPLSLHYRSNQEVEIFFQATGMGTELLSKKKAGETLDILGPLGRGFSLNKEFKGKEVFCVGGGRGIAPLFFLAKELQLLGARPTIFYGGKTSGDLPLRSKLEEAGLEIKISTDDGSTGFRGLVTSLVENELQSQKPAFVYACGPEAMMKKLSEICLKNELSAEFSLESIMGCGIGACWGCVRPFRKNGEIHYLKVCQDGPVFHSREIVWMGE
ncbi:MAG: dihydroorotate dehydrogenase electron transfer subunit [Candidatus Saccharicenans sp.]|nr:MAG: dihydroorotate dehydrogenase electron transfer subunit [Candidatus Aminicenantes bacterium]HEK85572.1 dihydroorotate dehydrogenase electron transfer subunit [Candidatus Aminicenantes bacterium]